MSPELTDFLTGLATDPDKLKAYIADPDAELSAAGVPASEQAIMKNNEFTKLSSVHTIMVFIVVQVVTGP